MNLPTTMIPYFYGLLHLKREVTTTTLEKFAKTSHDYLTRQLHKRYSWKEVLQHFVKKLELDGSYLAIDDTDINKKFAKKIKGIRTLYSHKDHCFFTGYSLLTVLWVTKRGIKVPLGFKVYSSFTKVSRIDLTIQLLEIVLTKWKLRPQCVVFDSFFAAEKVLKYCERNSLQYIGQLPSNRLLNGIQLKNIKPGATQWTKSGRLKGGVYVKVTKNGKKYFFTNNINLSGKQMRKKYKKRWKIEQFFRFCKSYSGLERCQSHSLQAQVNHFWVCTILYLFLQEIAQQTGLTVESIKTDIFIHREPHKFTLFKKVFHMYA